MTLRKEHCGRLLFILSLSVCLPFRQHRMVNEREGRKGHFPREIRPLSARDTLRKASGREWLPCHEKEKLLACQESWLQHSLEVCWEHTVHFVSVDRTACLRAGLHHQWPGIAVVTHAPCLSGGCCHFTCRSQTPCAQPSPGSSACFTSPSR